MIYRPLILLPFIIQPNFSKRGFIDYCVLPKKINQSSPNTSIQDFIKAFNEHQFHFRLTFDHAVSFFDATDKPDPSLSFAALNFAHALLQFKPHFLDVKTRTMLEFQKDHYVKRHL